MNIGCENMNRAASSRGADAAVASQAAESGASRSASGVSSPDGWVVPEKGVADVVRIVGEEPVDEALLRRDDTLGQLTAHAFDPETACAALPPLEPETAAAFRRMAQSTCEAKKTIIGNMVDTPEERKAKAEREAERRAEEDDREIRREKLEKKEQIQTRGAAVT